jgi:hypothetical protein
MVDLVMISRAFLAAALAAIALTAGEPSVQSALPDRQQVVSEDDLERRLAMLVANCQEMLDLQIAVRAATQALDQAVVDQEPRHAESTKLAAKEKEIVAVATRTIDLVAPNGDALAFREPFVELCEEMKRVQHRLETSDFSSRTQDLENDIIDTLHDMIKALKTR